MKKIISTTMILVMCLVLTLALVGCGDAKSLHDAEYNNYVNSYDIWDNDITEAIPQINVAKRIRDFLSSPSETGKAKKVLFLGYDGCRVDRLEDIYDVATGEPKADRVSAILETMDDARAGMYLGYAGGDKGTRREQATSTGPGWASLTTGVWKNKHGIIDNTDTKKPNVTTFMLDAATGRLGREYSSIFVGGTTMHFATQYIDEINYLQAHPRAGAKMPSLLGHDDFTIERGEWTERYDVAKVREYVRAVSDNTAVNMRYVFSDCTGKPDDFKYNWYSDYNTAATMIDAIENGTDVVFGIIDGIDSNGHRYGFSNEAEDVPEYKEAFDMAEAMSVDIVRAAKRRMAENNEDWLILMTTDHGGYNKRHGQQSFEERTIWIACNQGFDDVYYSRDYDGFRGELRY